MSSFLGTFVTIRTADQAHTVTPAASATAEITASAARAADFEGTGVGDVQRHPGHRERRREEGDLVPLPTSAFRFIVLPSL